MLIDPLQLQALQNQDNHLLLCCLLRPVGVSAESINESDLIPSSQLFDIDDFSATDAPFPHTLLSASEFEIKARALGINNDSSIVVCDNIGIYSAPRVWFNLTLMGCNNVLLLNGGIPAWKASGYPITHDSVTASREGDFSAREQSNRVATKEDVFAAIGKADVRIIDVRGAARFYGQVPEPRAGVRSGHIPGSANIPYANFIRDGRFKPRAELEKLFQDAGCSVDKELIFSCGSGVTACIGYLAALLCGYKNIRVYDGSWAEWGAIESLPVER